MFFDEILVKNEVLGKVWRAGNYLAEEPDGNTRLPTICRNLDWWVGSEVMDARKRLSLRTSSVLIDGAAKLYKKEMEQLIQDVAKLDEDIVLRNRREQNFEDASNSSGSCETPEQMMRRAEIHPDISFEGLTRHSLSPPSLRRRLSFISYDSPSPSKRPREEISYHESSEPNTDQSKDTTLRPWSESSSDQNSENTSTDEDIEQSELVRAESDKSDQSDRNLETDQAITSRSNGQRSEDYDHENETKSDGQGAEINSSDSQQETDNDQEKETKSDGQGSENNSSDSQQETDNDQEKETKSDGQGAEINSSDSQQETDNDQEKETKSDGQGAENNSSDSQQETDRISSDSPTYTDFFDFVASLPNNEDIRMIRAENPCDDARIATNFETDPTKRVYDGKSDRSSDIRAAERNSDDGRSAIEPDQSSQASQRSIILKSSKKTNSKLRRSTHKKRSKPIKQQKDQATQTVSFQPRTRDRDGLNENLPFACLLIHDSYKSSFPSKIVISSLNMNVNNLVYW